MFVLFKKSNLKIENSFFIRSLEKAIETQNKLVFFKIKNGIRKESDFDLIGSFARK